MTDCAAVVGLLPEFVAGDLPAAPAVLLRAHLRDCHACRIEAAGLLQARKALVAAAAAQQDGFEASRGAAHHGSLYQDILQAVAAVPLAAAPAGPGAAAPVPWAASPVPWAVRWRWLWSGVLLGAAALWLGGLLGWPAPHAAGPGRSLARAPLAATAGFESAFQPELGPGGWPMGLELLGHEVSDEPRGLRLAPLVEEWERGVAPNAAGAGVDGSAAPERGPAVWRKRPPAK